MNLAIHGSHVGLSSYEKTQLVRRLDFALGRFTRWIGKIEAFLGDINGPKGGVDKRCLLVVKLVPSGNLACEVRDSNMPRLIDRAARAIGHSIRQFIDRRRKGGLRNQRQKRHLDQNPSP